MILENNFSQYTLFTKQTQKHIDREPKTKMTKKGSHHEIAAQKNDVIHTAKYNSRNNDRLEYKSSVYPFFAKRIFH